MHDDTVCPTRPRRQIWIGFGNDCSMVALDFLMDILNKCWSRCVDGIEFHAKVSTISHVSRGRCAANVVVRSEEHTSELQSPDHLVCRLLLEKKKKLVAE